MFVAKLPKPIGSLQHSKEIESKQHNPCEKPQLPSYYRARKGTEQDLIIPPTLAFPILARMAPSLLNLHHLTSGLLHPHPYSRALCPHQYFPTSSLSKKSPESYESD
ncbi:conserved hypothetical protein [Ricinus communis]|uniref:Uncharacterized protein n=1 Tax=Ricinus communis TaxID=3988 RepID=B9RBX5_RICCO|nr:conserved hypothetical protein [Ricinus communis]